MTIALILTALVAVQTDAYATDIACVAAQISPGSDELLAEVSGTGPRPIRDSIRTEATRCASERSWSAEYSRGIQQLAAAQIFVPVARARLAQQGIRVDVIDEWLASTSLNFDAESADAQAALDSLERRLIGAGVTRNAFEANAQLIGIYVGAQDAARQVRRELDQSGRNPGNP